MTSSSSARTHFNKNQVYRCQNIVAKGSNSDWMILEMDRNFNENLTIKPSSKDRAGQDNNIKFTIIGHPSGLPKKIAANGEFLIKESSHIFRTSVDSYKGNSGSPVFNTESIFSGKAELEGILVNGNTDFIRKNDCLVENYCNANSTSRECSMQGEGVTDIRYIIDRLGSRAGNYFSYLSVSEPVEQELTPVNNNYTEPDSGQNAIEIEDDEARQLFNF